MSLKRGEWGRDIENTSAIEMSVYFTDTDNITNIIIIINIITIIIIIIIIIIIVISQTQVSVSIRRPSSEQVLDR